MPKGLLAFIVVAGIALASIAIFFMKNRQMKQAENLIRF
jgi:hypothetical protein